MKRNKLETPQIRKINYLKKRWLKDINIIIGEPISNEDSALFFQEEPGERGTWGTVLFLEYPLNTKWPEILFDLDIFSSRGDAYRTGFSKEKGVIPFGFNILKHMSPKWNGKRYRITTLKRATK